MREILHAWRESGRNSFQAGDYLSIIIIIIIIIQSWQFDHLLFKRTVEDAFMKTFSQVSDPRCL